MINKRLLLLFLLLIFRLNVYADFSFNSRCLEAYKDIFGLRLNEARALLKDEKQQNPQNGVVILLDNYVDYFNILVSDSKSDYEKLKNLEGARINALEGLDKNSPFYLFAQAEVYLHWGLLKGRYNDYVASARDLKKARSLLTENAKKYPDFILNQKSLALIDVVFGALPPNLKSLANFFGMKGNINAGVARLERVKNEINRSAYSFYDDEIIFLLCYVDIDVLHNKNNYTKLRNYLSGMDNNSLLKRYLQGYVAAKTGHNNDAIEYIEAIPKGGNYLSLPFANYLMGSAKLCRMDTDANIYLAKYINEYRGMNYIKDAYLKLAYFHLLRKETAKYNYYIKLVKTKGYAVDEKDKQALKEANDAKPDMDLLKARLYFDGGYYTKALAELSDRQTASFKLLRDRIEFPYRLGRIYERLDRVNEAIAYYQKAISLGRNTSYYYAANSALSIGGIYEHRKDKRKAADYYKQAIDMKDHEYESSIENQAKDGLERVN